MVAWEKQIEERSVPAWRDKYVNYASLKRKLDRLKKAKSDKDDSKITMKKALYEVSETHPPLEPLRDKLLPEEEQELVEDFMQEVYRELDRVSTWYDTTVSSLESRVRSATGGMDTVAGAAGLQPNAEKATEEIEALHLEAAQLTEFVLLNVEALRKIVKKMDKLSGTSRQKEFVEQCLKTSALATPDNPKQPFNGHRARRCRQELEARISPELLQELRSKAMMQSSGAGLAKLSLRRRRAACCAVLAAAAVPCSAPALPGAERAQRCVGLVVFTVAMWVSEAAPFEATALLVPPLAVLLSVLEGSRGEQGKLVVDSVFSESLYLVLCGFVVSSVFSRCQLECRTAAALQRRLGGRPFLFLLAIMFLGLGLSAVLSNVTAPLLLIEVLKPLLRDMPTDSRYSRALLLGLAFSCNVGGMATPISSPQNIAALAILRQHGGDITWAQWLAVSIPFCTVAVLAAWLLLLVVHHFDCSAAEAARCNGQAGLAQIPEIVFDGEELTAGKVASLVCACVTLGTFACQPVAELFGGTAVVAILFVAVALATGMITRQTFDSYSWHLLFLIGGGSALGLVVSGSGLLGVLTEAAQAGLASEPFPLVAQLVLVLVAATTFVSHTVAALVFMPLVVQLGASAGVAELAVLVGGLACSAACALPMTSFPNVNSLMAADDHGKPWLAMRHFLAAGIPMTLTMTALLVTYGFWLADLVT